MAADRGHEGQRPQLLTTKPASRRRNALATFLKKEANTRISYMAIAGIPNIVSAAWHPEKCPSPEGPRNLR